VFNRGRPARNKNFLNKPNLIIIIMKKKRILFICTGNVFRSMSAEYALKKYLTDNAISGWHISSAGIIAIKESIDQKILNVLKELGIKSINHKQKKLTGKMLNGYDVIIAMAENHKHFIKSKFNHKTVFLFNELAINKKESVWDIEDEVKDYLTNRKAIENKIERTIKYIFNKTPALFKNISERYFLFSEFVNGSKKHRNGFPFIELYGTKNTVAFMSIDIPEKEDGHILVIPKKRYEDISEIPKIVLNELIQSIVKIGTSIKVNHGGYNILLNNGIDAGQYILHTHFHLIPRSYNDEIGMEIWKNKKISSSDFVKLNNLLKKQINKG